MTNDFTRPLSTLLTSVESFFTEKNVFNGAEAISSNSKSKVKRELFGEIYNPYELNVPIYCITSKSDSVQRQRMLQRFHAVNIYDKINFITRIEEDMPILRNYDTQSEKKEVARYASHIKSLRAFLENIENEYCIICQDDILLSNNFIPDFNAVIHNANKDTTLISLAWYVNGGIDQHYVGKSIDIRNLWNVDVNFTHGSYMYYIHREYALTCIECYDRSHEFIKKTLCIPHITADLFVQRSHGYISSVPIAIYDCVEQPDLSRYFCRWDYDSYSRCDISKSSPLSKMKPSDSWMNYPYSKTFYNSS
jgi:hypothetical protein